VETRDHLAEIYQTIDIEAALPELNPKDRGSYYELDCPVCGAGKRAFLYKGSHAILCNRRNACGKSSTLWDYVQKRDGLTQGETLKRLAELAGYALPSLDRETQERIRTAQTRASLLETVLDYFKVQLYEREPAVLDYLKGRGYTEQEVDGMELGLFPAQTELARFVAGYVSPRPKVLPGGKVEPVNPVNTVNPVDTVYSLGLTVKGMGETHKLAIPYRDPAGRLKGFAVRAIGPKVEPKYLYTAGLERDTLFNLHRARASRESELILVEGYLDALIATERGLPGVVAVGGANLTERQLEAASRYQVQRFTLALDSDPAGQDGTERTLNLLDRRGLSGFVVTLPAGYKDPDELIRDPAQGIEAFGRLVDGAESAGRWRAGRILGKQDLSTDKGKRAAIDGAIVVAEQLSPPDVQDLMDKMIEQTGLRPELFGAYLESYRQRQAQERLKLGYQGLSRDLLRLTEEGKLREAGELIAERGRDLGAKTSARTLSPYRLGEFKAEIAQTPEGLQTGYPALDKLVAIPQAAITIVAGRPGHGKTTTLLNLLLNMSRVYQGKTFVLFSYEEQRRQIALKLLDILAGRVILSGEVKDPGLNLRELENYLRAGKTDRPAVEWGKVELGKLLDSGRVLLVDEPYLVEDWADTLTALSSRCSIGAVFVDYIQKVKIAGKYPTRQVELQRVSERILETAKSLSLPVILGAQLGRDKDSKDKVKLDNLRECGDIEQDANLVLGLFNPAAEKAYEDGERLKDPVVPLSVTVLKNRNGAVNDVIPLKFNRPLFTLSPEESTW
jgi:DNA primase catalytic core